MGVTGCCPRMGYPLLRTDVAAREGIRYSGGRMNLPPISIWRGDHAANRNGGAFIS